MGPTGDSGVQRARLRLAAALTGGRPSHAYLIAGGGEGEGVELARDLARALLCLEPRAGWACRACLSCRQVDGGVHPALRWVKPDGAYVRIEQVRAAAAELWLRPPSGPRRLCVIEQADRLTLPAANALLKSLEDPPPHAALALVARNPSALPPTVPSRCQVLKLGAGAAGAAETEPVAALGAAAAQVLERLESGPPGAFLALAEEVLESPLGQDGGVGALLDRLQAAFRDALVLAVTRGAGPLLCPDDREATLALAASRSAQRLWAGLEALEAARQALARNANPRLCLEALFLRLRG